MLQIFFEHTINKAYQNCRSLVFFFASSLPTTSSYIKFGGWEMSYDWKGLTKPARETVGNFTVITKTIYFNYKYALRLMNVGMDKEYNFPHFVRTIAHEIAHCLLIDYDPKYLNSDDQHNELHRILTTQLEAYLWTLSEIQELANFTNWDTMLIK